MRRLTLPVPVVKRASKSTRAQALLKRFKKCLGYTPKDISLYTLSLVHKSAASEYRACNERLEFLGDAVLSAVVSEALYLRYPDKDEGFLTQMRAKVVSRSFLNALAQTTGLCTWMQIRPPQGVDSSRNVAGDMLEALVGAIYIDRGYSMCRKVIMNKLLSSVKWEDLESTEQDFKSRIIERGQKQHSKVLFQTDQISKEHTHAPPSFFSRLFIDDLFMGSGEGSSKKEAEQAAARRAWIVQRGGIGEEEGNCRLDPLPTP